MDQEIVEYMEKFVWDVDAQTKFKQLMERIPPVMQGMAGNAVLKVVGRILEKEGKSEINEKVLVDAFFTATPFGFHGPMKADMAKLGINYTQYGHPQ